MSKVIIVTKVGFGKLNLFDKLNLTEAVYF